MKRSLLIVITGIVAVVLIAAFAIPALVDVNRYRPQIETLLENQFGRDFSLGAMRLTLFPFAFRVNNAVIAESPEFRTGRPFAQMPALYVKPEFFPLLRGNLVIDSLELTRPTVEFVRNTDGTWNFATLSRNRGKPLTIDRLQVDDGEIAVTDLQQKKARAIYHHIDLDLRDFESDGAFSLEARAHLPGEGDQMIRFDGAAGPVDPRGLARTPFDGKVEFDDVSVAGLQRLLNLKALENSDAVITGSATVRNDAGAFESTGKLVAQSPRIRGVGISSRAALDYDVSGNLDDNKLQIRRGDLKIDQMPVHVNGRIDAQRTPAFIDLNIEAANASMAEAARLAAAFDIAFTGDTKVTGNMDLKVRAQGAADRPQLSGTVATRNVNISGGDLAQPVHAGEMNLSLSPDAIQSNDFTATTGKTSVTAQFTLADYTSGSPQVNARIHTGSAQVSELLNIARAYGMSAVEGVKGTGTAQLNVSVAGPIKQTDRLTYTGEGALRNSTIEVPSLAKPIAVRNADMRFNANSVTLDNLDLSLGETTARGNATVQNLANPRVQFALAANTINVPEWQAMSQPNPRQPNRDSLLRRLTGSGRVSADTVVYDELLMKNVKATVQLDKGIIRMNPIDGELHGGHHTGAVTLNLRTQPASYTIDSELQQVDANKLLSSVSNVKDKIFGVLSANADARFSGTADGENIARSLDGTVSLSLRDGSIANMDLLYQMASIAKFLQTARPVEPATEVSVLSGDFNITDGVAHTSNLTAAMDAGSLAATGSIDLPQQKLNLRVTAVLSKEYSDIVGGTAIGGIMTTAVANRKGELVVPMIVTGTFQNPRFAPDLQRVAEMKLKDMAPSTDNPADFGVDLLERIFGKKPEPPVKEGPPPEEPEQEQPPIEEPPPAEEPPQEEPKQPEKEQPQTIPDVLREIFRRL